jgi:Skp family chaperone for outer membrane proteins
MIFSSAKNMKRLLFLLLTVSVTAVQAQRGVKIGYIDMEYILQNVPDYAEANNQLEQKAAKWKQEIEVKKNDVQKLKDALDTEKVLLTKELVEEREEEIKFQETELLDLQQKRFGPSGDLMSQKAVLIKPIQDQVFTAAQDIAEAKKFDFIFDKSSDMTMLFAAKRFDISDQVLRVLTRAANREQKSKKQLEQDAKKEALEDMEGDNPAKAERQKLLDEKKAEREKLAAEKKEAAEQRRKDAEAKRAQLKAEKEAKRNGTTVPVTDTPKTDGDAKNDSGSTDETVKTTQEDSKKKAQDERAKIIADRKKAQEDKKAKILADREAAKKAKQDGKTTDTVPASPTTEDK